MLGVWVDARRLLKTAKYDRREIAWAVALVTCLNLLSVGIVWVTRALVDEAIASRNMLQAAQLCVVMFLAPVLSSLLSYELARRTVGVPTEWAHQQRVAALAKCFRLSTARLGSELRGEMVNLWGTDIAALESWIMEIIPLLVSNVVRLNLSLLSMLLFEPMMTVIALGLCPVPLVVAKVVNQRLKPVWANLQENRTIAFQSGLQMVDAYETVRLNGLEDYAETQFAERSRNLRDASRRSILVSKIWNVASSAANGVGPACLAVIGAVLVMTHATTLGTFAAFSTAFSVLQASIREISHYIVNMSKIESHAMRLRRYHDAPEEVRGTATIGRNIGDLIVEVEDLRIEFSGFVLTCDYLAVHKGEKLAVIGPSGVGKTTLLRAMSGLIVPNSGHVRINGVDTRSIDPKSLREFVAFHSQSPALFPDTVDFNVTLGRAVPGDAIDRALAALNMSHIRERGPVPRYADLSEGERQRLALCRLLVDDRPLLLLDEPTSALDNENENRFFQELLQTRTGATIIIVSHRPAVLSYVDRVVEMNHGQVRSIGRGSHAKSIA